MVTVDLGRLTDNSFFFADDPIVATLTPNNFTEGSTFRQIVVKVDATLHTLGAAKSHSYKFILNAEENNVPVVTNVSSAMRSILAGWDYDAGSVVDKATISYPYVAFRVSAWEREMTSDGIVVDRDSSSQGLFRAYLGGVGGYTRWKYTGDYPTINDSKVYYPSDTVFSFTRKPAGEVYGNDFLLCTSAPDGVMVKTSITKVSGSDTRNRVTFLFVNSRGVFETISVLPYESLSYEVISSRKSLFQPPSYASKPIATTHKQGGGAVWQMSSGYVSRDWADWYASEFLMAKRYWMQFDGAWLPVTVEPTSDQVVVYDREDPSLKHVPFEVRAAVNGSVR